MVEYAFSFDEEHFQGSCADIEDALEQVKSEPEYDEGSRIIFVGESVPVEAKNFYPGADEILERMFDISCDHDKGPMEWTEWPIEEVKKEHVEELQIMFHNMLNRWFHKYQQYKPHWFYVENIKEYNLNELDKSSPRS